MSKWSFDLDKTRDRWQQLNRYYESVGLNACSFHCKDFSECKTSQKNTVIKQFSGGTSALMPLYDIFYQGKPIRILIIGKETGYMKNTEYGTAKKFHENTLNVLNCINWDKKNNHIKGTLKTLQYIYNLDTEYVYSSYVLTNLLRCSFQDFTRSDSVSAVHDTSTMRKNCYKHLIKEIEILEPTLVIAQGEWSTKKNGLIDVLNKRYHYQVKCIMQNKSKKYGLYQTPDFMCITSHHPAILGNWIKNLAPDSLWPMLDYLKTTGHIPSVSSDSLDEYEEMAMKIVDPIIINLQSNDYLRKTKYNTSMEKDFE